MDDQTQKQIRRALERSWCADTCIAFAADNPAANHCAQTAIVLQRKFGGDILMTGVRGDQIHVYNRIDGQRLDFTADQFTLIPGDTWRVEYDDTVISVAEAMTLTNPRQIDILLRAFEASFVDAHR